MLPLKPERAPLVGVITVDDVIDAIVEEQTEDVQRLGAVQPLEDPYFVSSFWDVTRRRVVWLVVLFIGEMFTSTALHAYEQTLAQALFLTAFIPLIISSGGNSGSQSATLIIRALAVGDVEMRDAFRVLSRELGQGLVLGGVGLLVGVGLALVLGRFLSSLLYGVAPYDPLTFVAAAGVLLVVVLLASFVPARRATRIDPVKALHEA